MKLFIAIFLFLNFQVYAYKSSNFMGTEFKSESINVYSKSYRYANRIFYREKRSATRLCMLRSKELVPYLDGFTSFSFVLTNRSIRVGAGKISTVQFSCDISLSSSPDMEITEYEMEVQNNEDCLEEEKNLKMELNNELVFSTISRNRCFIQVVSK